MQAISGITRFPLLFLLVSLFGFVSIPAINAGSHHRNPLAKEGVLDLQHWDFKRDGTVNLAGEWAFYWDSFLDPNVPTSNEYADQTGFIKIPGCWNGYVVDGTPVSGQGHAAFRLRILLPPANEELAVKVGNILTAYKLYINQKLVLSAGNPGKTPKDSKPASRPLIADFTQTGSEIELLVQVSNYHHKKGGIWEVMQLGTEKKIREERQRGLAFDLFLFSTIFIMGLYHLSLFLHGRNDKASLDFGLFCLAVAVRTLVTGEMAIFQVLGNVPWSFISRLEYLGFYAGLPLFNMYLHSIFPKDVYKPVLRIVQVLGTGFCLFVILTPATVYSYSVQAYQAVTAVTGIYAVFILLKAVVHKRQGSLILLSGFLFMFAAVINDVLHANQLVYTSFYLPLGLLGFLLSQAFLLALRFTMAFETADRQTRELEKTNTAYRHEIAERKKLEKNLIKSHEQFGRSRLAIILGLAKLAEYRDEDTGAHLERIREYSRILARELARLSKYKGYITDAYIKDLFDSSILHDIGKVGVPDSILLKPGKLTPEEFKIIQRHTLIGGDALQNVESKMHIQSFLTLGKEIAYHHHEKWDGSGYPKKLKGKDIPLSARIVALADVYDALTSERPYKKRFSHDKAKAIIIEGRGSHFDPVIVDTFLNIETIFDEIRRNVFSGPPD